jgi:nitroimidazol reductase NimA-like FMN-containing flavoprotein (pyridoxamine 5'-phosphate oxidase superfamily)
MRRLGSTQLGRIVFTRHAMPAIRPVNHLIDSGYIILRSHEDSAIPTGAASQAGTVVAYEADDIDPATGAGWSVIVTGLATIVTDSAQVARYLATLHSWAAGEESQIIRIDPGIITGTELTTEQLS